MQRGLNDPSVHAHPISGFTGKGHAMEPQFSVSGEYVLIN